MIGTLFSAKQLVRRIQNQLIKTFDKAVNRKLERALTIMRQTKFQVCCINPQNFFFNQNKNGQIFEDPPVLYNKLLY